MPALNRYMYRSETGFSFTGQPCDLSTTWSGQWFEYGERNAIQIDVQNITHKGTCTRRHGDKYIFKDP